MHRPISANHHDRSVERRAGDRHEHAAGNQRFQRVLTRIESTTAAREGAISGISGDDPATGEGTLGLGAIEELMALLAAGPDVASTGDAPATASFPGAATEPEEGAPVPEPAFAPNASLPEAVAEAPNGTPSPQAPPSAPSAINDNGMGAPPDAPPSMVLPSTAALATGDATLADDASLAAKALAEGAPPGSNAGPAPAETASGARGQSRPPALSAGHPQASPITVATSANPPPTARHAATPTSTSPSALPFAGEDVRSAGGEGAAGLATGTTLAAHDGASEAAPDAPSGAERDDVDGTTPGDSDGGIMPAPDGEPTALGAGGDRGGEGSSHPSGGEDRAPKAASGEASAADAGLKARFVEAQALVQRQRPGWVEVSVADHPLGTLDVILRMQQDGDLSVTVRASSDDALATLRQHADQLATAVSGADGAPIALGFELRDQGGRGAGEPSTDVADHATALASSEAVAAAPSAIAYATNARAAIDIRV